MTVSTRLRAIVVALAASALVTITLPAGPAAAVTEQAASASQRDAGRWLARQLNDRGVVHNGQYQYDDLGLTIDTALALDALGGHAAKLGAARRALASNVASYTTYDDGTTVTTYANSVAKLAAFAGRVGADPRSFGGSDLVATLEGLVSSSAPTTGRIEDSAGSDYANTLGQAFAAEALVRAGSARADDALAFLLQQQCASGGFRLYFSDKTAPDQTCDAAAGQADVDATSVAVVALGEVQGHDAVVAPALAAARAYLKGVQKPNGGFVGNGAVNANSTGLAAQALAATGACGAAAHAAQWIRARQVPAGDTTKLRRQVGAIAYNQAALVAGRTDGITQATRDQWRRASAQAAPALLDLRAAACRA